jgi:hypothetical protein
MKNVFVENKTGAFGDRAGYYLQKGRPSMVQETGWSSYLPTGAGLFAVGNIRDVINALDQINSNYEYHARAAIEIAYEYLDARKALKSMLSRAGF